MACSQEGSEERPAAEARDAGALRGLRGPGKEPEGEVGEPQIEELGLFDRRGDGRLVLGAVVVAGWVQGERAELQPDRFVAEVGVDRVERG